MKHRADALRRDWQIACPRCRSAELEFATANANCLQCGCEFAELDGIWDFLPGDRAEHYREFLQSYTRIRHAEQRGCNDRQFYCELPNCPAGHPVAWQWRIRRRSFAVLSRFLREKLAPQSRIVDAGAGVGWLSHQLWKLGHRPCAVDISIDAEDGLAAARYLDGDWPVLRAEFDRLPLADNQADALIFNGSFHYSTEYPATLGEACRVVTPGGLIVILDTPIYRDPASGGQMLKEQSAGFARKFGDRSDALPHQGFLSWDAINSLGEASKLQWSVVRPWYGLAWTLRPAFARLRGRREPARFAILCGINHGEPFNHAS